MASCSEQWLLFASLVASLPAQQTWIVDPTGAGNFTSLGPAIAAAVPGDTLVLRGGNYPGGFQVDKAINFIGDTPRPRVGSLAWSTLPAGSPPFVLSGFDLVSAGMFIPFNSPPQTVSFDSMTVANVRFFANWTAAFTNCTLGGRFDHYGQQNREAGLVIGGSAVTVSGCTIDGGHAWGFFQGIAGCQAVPGGDAVRCTGGDVTITSSTLRGPDSQLVTLCGVQSAAGHALHINGGIARLTQSTLIAGTSAYGPVPPVLNFGPSSGTFEYDPSTQFTPANTFGTPRFLPGTSGQSTAPGGTMTCRLESGPNLPAALVASLGLTGPTPVPEGIAWIDPSAFVVLLIGFTDPSGVLASAIPIPAWVPRGLPITVQGAAANGATAPLVGGAAVVLHVL